MKEQKSKMNTKEALLKYYRTGGVIKPPQTVSEKTQTKASQKKIQKTEKSVRTVKQRTIEFKEQKENALRKMEKWSPEKQQALINKFEELVKKGRKDNHIRDELGFKSRNEYRWFIESKYEKETRAVTLKSIRISVYSKRDTATEQWQEFRKGEKTFDNRVERGFCPIVSTPNRSVLSRKYPPIDKGGTFCKEIKVIPDLSVQPIKRIRIAAHSFVTADEWSNGEKIKKLSVRYCTNTDDKYLTHEGGIIISENLSNDEGLNKGDKLLGINGLKGVICEVRDMNVNLLINKNQVWDKKSSKKCGGAVLELRENNTLACFYQKSHTIRDTIFVDEMGHEYAKGKFSKQARYSADLVPFLFHHLGFKTMIELTNRNRKRVKEVLRFMNAGFVIKEGQMMFKPHLKPCEPHKGGKCEKFGGFLYSKLIWREPLDKTGITMYDTHYYHYIQKKLWIPEWLSGEPYMEYKDKDNLTQQTALGVFITGKIMGRKSGAMQQIVHLLYDAIYGEIENSINYLIAVPTATNPTVLILNETDCSDANIEEDEEVLVWRPPVVSARLPKEKYTKETKHSNIMKLTVKYGANQKTAEINVATMRLMFGDFDGDALYVMKIPKNAAEDLKPRSELDKEVELIRDEVCEVDTIKIPQTKDEILISMRTAFLKEEINKEHLSEKEGTTLIENLSTTNTEVLRDTGVLLHEARINHEEAIIESEKITQIGGLTKWAWMAAQRNEIAGLTVATQSIEIMKDRPKADEEGYLADKKYLMALKQRLSKSKLKSGYNNFVKFTSQGAYRMGIEKRRKVPTYVEFADKALCPSDSIIGKWLQLLTL